VVDDDFAMTSVLSEVLRTWGYEVAIGGASDTALEVLPKYKPDLVTTDIENPPLGGWAVIEAVNKLTPAIPVVVLAGCDGLSVPSGVRVTSFLPKPFKSAQLKRVIECALKGIGNLEGKPSKQP
jgi:two-component SAPR family response regulator